MGKEGIGIMTKGVFVLLLLVCLSIPQVFAVATTPSDTLYAADASVVRFLPTTISAGDTVTLAVDVTNKGSYISLNDMNLTFTAGDYFETVQSTASIAHIEGGATKTAVLTFRVKDTTQPGYYQAFLALSYNRVDQSGSSMIVSQNTTITVPVSSGQKNLGISINPMVINPGNKTPVTFSVTNFSSHSISNVLLSWTEVSGIILPLGSDNRKFAALISPGGSIDFNYLLVADPSITTGVYPLTVALSYTDTAGTQTQSSQVGLIVGGKTDFQVSADAASTGQLSFSIANIGSNNASAVVVQLARQAGLTITGSDTVIIGNINKGDYSIASFTASVDQNMARAGARAPGTGVAPDQNTLSAPRPTPTSYKVDIFYTDTTGERQHLVQSFELNARTIIATGFGGRVQGGQDLSVFFPLGVLIVLLLGAIGYNKFKAKKSWKQFALFAGTGFIVPLVLLYFLPGNGGVALLAGAFFTSALAWFFLKGGK